VNASRRFRLGLLALLSACSFVAMLGFVLQGVLRQNRQSFFILFDENVKGMVIGSKVNFQGVPFGSVKDIRFQGGKTLVELSVDPTRAEIQDITRARLDRLLVTGVVTVELEGYGPQGTPLRPGQFVAPKADPIHQLTTTLPELIPQVTSLLERTSTLVDRGNDLLADDNRAAFASLLRDGQQAASQLPATLRRADAALDALQRAADDARRDLLPSARAALEHAQTALADLKKLVGEAQAMFGSMRAPAFAALSAVRSSLDELRDLARQVRLAPDSLIFGVTRPAAPAGGDR
jgi:phospholipid/cholesterol/gamma-HCH transport system substrate-binding protein